MEWNEPNINLDKELLKESPHIKYLFSYLCTNPDAPKAKIALVEKEYVSRSYLYDYANYYALGFNRFERHCRRIHFFKCEKSQEYFQTIFDRQVTPDENLFNDDYIGYVILRPLRHAPFGATILKPYSSEGNNGKIRLFKLRNQRATILRHMEEVFQVQV